MNRIHTITISIVAAFASTLSFGDLPTPPRGPIPEVKAVSTGAVEMPVWRGPAIDDGMYPKSPSSLPTDLPAPMPNPDTMATKDAPSGDAYTHNLQTGETRVLPMRYLGSGEEGGSESTQFAGIFGEIIGEGGHRTYQDLELVNSPSTYPRSTACRIRMQYTDTDGLAWQFVGSAHLIDAETLLTAGHCVYTDQFVDSGGTTRVVNDWVDWIKVYPGSHQGTDHWGMADATYVGAFAGWTDDDDFDWDIGVIRINRAVGMLAGWTGWRWGDSCSTIRSRTYHNFSFPSASCGANDSDGNPLHNGADMYYRYGQYDSCPGNQLHIDTTAGCFTTSHGGMSGSGYYFIDGDGDRLVHAQHSNGNGSTSSNSAKIWENMSDYLVDTFVPGSRGSTFDLQSMWLRSEVGNTEPTTYDAGDTVSDMKFTSANATNGSDSGTWYVDFYVSTDDTINTSDTYIEQQSFTWDYDPMDEVNVGLGDFDLPVGLETGTYYLGVRFDGGSDSSSWNNETSGWDAYEIFVNDVTDGEAVSVSFTGDTLIWGDDDLSFAATVTNNGAQSSTAIIQLYASTNQTITTSDHYLGSFYRTLPGNDSVDIDQGINIPASLPDDAYYLGIIVNTVTYLDIDSSNNAMASSYPFTKVTAPSNDACSDAVSIYLGDTAFTNLYATTDGVAHPECEVAGDGGVTEHDVWYTFVPPVSGVLTVSTCDQVDYDSDVVLYQGDCGNLNFVACNDDGTGCSGYSSHLEAPVQQGGNYVLRIGGWNYSYWGSGTVTVSMETSSNGDVNGDGEIDVNDLLILIASWGSDGSNGTDLNGDGIVDVNDALILIANWG